MMKAPYAALWTPRFLLAIAAGLLSFFAFGIRAAEPLVSLPTQTAKFAIDSTGSLSGIASPVGERNYIAAGQPAPLLSVRVEGRILAPTGAEWDAGAKQLTLRYGESGVRTRLKAEAKPTHIVLEVAEVQPLDKVELVLWGPYPTTIGSIIGETVGVVRDETFAIGIQSLNAKTLGGYPTQESDIESDLGADDPGRYDDLPDELRKGQHFRGDTARPRDFGSVLQAFCRNRDRDRVIANWGHEKYLAPAFRDGGVVGSRIALFAGPASAALETIGAIEVVEGLPHPLIDGVWGKVARHASCSYLIVDFGEDTVDRAIEMTRRAGLRYLYHSSPFDTWGHFRLKPDLFPNGWAGLRKCVDRARQAGVRIGFHTLSNFITPNDAYVTPEPDPRLAVIDACALVGDVDAGQREVEVVRPDPFRKSTAMNAVRIGKELVRYTAVSTNAPWRLLECERGAWGTRAAAHGKGEVVAKLMDHDYKVFLTDADLAQEVARNIAKLCNETDARQLSFDGLEGNWSTGMGQYGRTLFTLAWYEALTPALRGEVINDASNPGHFNWHIYTRMNWGEPWYAGFRESQTLYRFKNQLYFERNLMPRMLGWFALRADTSIEDAEWLLARAAGFNAGFTLAASLASTAQLAADPASADAARQFGATPAILEAVNQWETARMAGAFPAEVRRELQDNHREFHLEKAGVGRWNLFPAHTERFAHDAGQTAATRYSFTNRYEGQPLQWIVRSVGKESVHGVALTVGDQLTVAMETQSLPAGGSLRYGGGSEAVVYDAAWKEVARVPAKASGTRIGTGPQPVALFCRSQPGVSLKVELRTLGPARVVSSAAER